MLLWKQRKPATEFKETMARQIGTGREVMAISCNTSERGMRVLTGTRNRHIQVWALDSRYNPSNIFSVELPVTVPCTVYSHGTDVVVFGMYDGEM